MASLLLPGAGFLEDHEPQQHKQKRQRRGPGSFVVIFTVKSVFGLSAGLILAAVLVAAPEAGAAASPRPGEFDICQGCHGVRGQGNAELGAPRIAGLDARYLGRQLANFRDKRRGTNDSLGEQMITIAAMLDDTAIGRLSAYISGMPEVETTQALMGDAQAGRSEFVTCAACHGAAGEGNVALGGPRLGGMSDWYLARQFAAFAAGERGATPGDEPGAVMRAIAAGMKNGQAARDVIVYAASLTGSAAAAPNDCVERDGRRCGSSR